MEPTHESGNQLKTRASQYALVAAAILLASVGMATVDAAPGYGATEHDRITATSSEALTALEIVRKLRGKNLQTGTDAIALYHAEEKIGAFRRVFVGESDAQQIAVDCESYVNENRAGFRVVHDG